MVQKALAMAINDSLPGSGLDSSALGSGDNSRPDSLSYQRKKTPVVPSAKFQPAYNNFFVATGGVAKRKASANN